VGHDFFLVMTVTVLGTSPGRKGVVAVLASCFFSHQLTSECWLYSHGSVVAGETSLLVGSMVVI
jgi:hypothetical protein